MRMAIVAAALGFLAMAAPAHAQMRTSLSGGSMANVPQNSGGGGGGGGSFGSGGVSGGHALTGISREVRFQNSSAHGCETDFQPTAYVPYEQAVRMGEAALSQPAKTLGEIAAEYRAAKARRD